MNSILKDINIVSYDSINKDRWDNFCLKESEAWFWHTSKRVEHVIAVAGSSSVNKSFYLQLNKEIIAICPLILSYDETSDYVISHSGWGAPLPVISEFLSIRYQKKIKNLIFNQIEIISSKFNVSKILISKFPQIRNETKAYYFYNDLIELGYMNSVIFTAIINLKNSEEEIYSNFRNNHKRDIKKYSQSVRVEYIDASNVSKKNVKEFKEYYFKIAKKNTHPNKVFDIIFSMLKEGSALLVRGYLGEKIYGNILLITYKNQAYYLLGAQNDDIYPVIKILLFNSIKYLKSLKYESFELGRMEFEESFFNKTNSKRIAISQFKKGFGGKIYPINQSIKYFNQDALRLDIDTLINSKFNY